MEVHIVNATSTKLFQTRDVTANSAAKTTPFVDLNNAIPIHKVHGKHRPIRASG